jgi:hypothetical protein
MIKWRGGKGGEGKRKEGKGKEGNEGRGRMGRGGKGGMGWGEPPENKSWLRPCRVVPLYFRCKTDKKSKKLNNARKKCNCILQVHTALHMTAVLKSNVGPTYSSSVCSMYI